jgi:LysM repeat protein
VEAGDTLSAIAARFDTTVAVLVELNAIEDAANLQIGQELRLP